MRSKLPIITIGRYDAVTFDLIRSGLNRTTFPSRGRLWSVLRWQPLPPLIRPPKRVATFPPGEGFPQKVGRLLRRFLMLQSRKLAGGACRRPYNASPGDLPDLLPKRWFDFGIDPHGEAADAHPEQGEGQADLSPEVQRGVPIVPDRIVPVENKARRQLDHGDDARPDEDFRPGRQAVLRQPPQQQKADSSGQEHGIMAPSPPEKLNGHVQHPAAEEQGQPVKKPFFHKNHLTGKDSQKTCEKFRNSS